MWFVDIPLGEVPPRITVASRAGTILAHGHHDTLAGALASWTGETSDKLQPYLSKAGRSPATVGRGPSPLNSCGTSIVPHAPRALLPQAPRAEDSSRTLGARTSTAVGAGPITVELQRLDALLELLLRPLAPTQP
jgi:hypothetical protein